MVESINGVSGAKAAFSAASISAAQRLGKKNIPMTDMSKLSPEQKQAIENLKQLVKAGKVEYHDTNFLEDVLDFFMENGKSGDFIIIRDFADSEKYKDGLTFGQAKSILKLNLPPGSLRCNMQSRGGGDFDQYLVPKERESGKFYLDIFLEDLQEATGLTKEEIKSICEAE